MIGFARVQSVDRELNQVQSNIATALQPLQNNALLPGRFINGVSLAIGSTTIYHSLGRPLAGWIITSIDGASSVYDEQSSNDNPQLTLVLNSSAAVTVNLYVF